MQSPPLGHTPGHVDCPRCNAKKAEKLEPAQFGLLYFEHAAKLWLTEHDPAKHKSSLNPKTFEQHEYYVRTLERFFKDLPLNQIHIGHLESYIEERIQAEVSAGLVRKEVNCLKQILDRAGLWVGSDLERFYKPPKITTGSPGRPLTTEEKERLLTVAASKKRWTVAFWCTNVMLMGVDAGELTALRVKDFDIVRKLIWIREGLKTLHRDRIVALADPQGRSFWAMGRLLKRYYSICRQRGITPNPDHYIMPGRERSGQYDPTKRMLSWKRAWGAICKQAGVTLRRKDLRHDAATALGQANVPPLVIANFLGHADEEMQKLYFHAQLGPLFEAASKIQIPVVHSLVETVENLTAIDPNPREIKEEQKAKNSA